MIQALPFTSAAKVETYAFNVLLFVGLCLAVGLAAQLNGQTASAATISIPGAVRVTIARWYTPNNRLIHETGLTPDVEVLPDVAEGADPQLDKAIELLLGATAQRR